MRVNVEVPKPKNMTGKLDASRVSTASSVSHSVSPFGIGAAMTEPVLQKMNSAFGTDFSNVVVHESPIIEKMGAEAASMGAHIAFAPGKYRPESMAGQALLGHELAHVVQQAEGMVTGTGFLDDASMESAADRQGLLSAHGQRVFDTDSVGISAIPAMTQGSAAPIQAKKKDRQAVQSQPASTPTQQSVFDTHVGNISQELQAQGANPNKQGGDSPALRYTNTLVGMGWRGNEGSKPKADTAFKQMYKPNVKAQQKLQAAGLNQRSFDRYKREDGSNMGSTELAGRGDYAADVGQMNDLETGMIGEMLDDANMQELLRAKYQGFAGLSEEARTGMGGESGIMSALLSDIQLRMSGPALAMQSGMTSVAQGSMSLNNASGGVLLDKAEGTDVSDLTDDQLAEAAASLNDRLSSGKGGDQPVNQVQQYTNVARLRHQIAMMNRIRGIVSAPGQEAQAPTPQLHTARTVDQVPFDEGVHSRPAYASTPVPEEISQDSSDDERLAALYQKIRNPEPGEDPEDVSRRKRTFAELRAQQYAREQRTPAVLPKKKSKWQFWK